MSDRPNGATNNVEGMDLDASSKSVEGVWLTIEKNIPGSFKKRQDGTKGDSCFHPDQTSVYTVSVRTSSATGAPGLLALPLSSTARPTNYAIRLEYEGRI
jgi:hypothetical protein